jgi:hypothetical protein
MTVKSEDLSLVRKRLADFIDSAEVIEPPGAYDKLVALLVDLDQVIIKSKKQT